MCEVLKNDEDESLSDEEIKDFFDNVPQFHIDRDYYEIVDYACDGRNVKRITIKSDSDR